MTAANLHVFAYGSLMFAPVWQRVVGGGYRSVPAVLDGYACHEVAGETYPGIIAVRDASVRGVLYLDVTAADIAALDAFEGPEYRRDSVRVSLESGATADAAAYVYLLPQRLSAAPWRPEAFSIERFIAAWLQG